MELIFTAVEDGLQKAFETHLSGLENVTVVNRSIFDVDCDAVVSPANSFGFMDGGIDAFYTGYFGPQVQDNVRMAVLRYWHGELPVGAAEIVATENTDFPYLIAAPTMRVPMWLGPETINPYLAMRAIIILLREGNFKDGEHAGKPVQDIIKTVAIPGLGTGVGQVPYDLCAHQIRRAIESHSSGRHYLPRSWAEAVETQQELITVPKVI